MSMTIDIRSGQFTLHPSGAIFWHEKKMLLIADVHFGKVAHFRKNGSAVPAAASEENYRKLNDLIRAFDPEVICFLGDLFHSYLNSEWYSFEYWVATLSAQIILVTGNHDIISPHKFEAIEIEVRDRLEIDDFLLTHHPTEDNRLFNFSGHIHPGIHLVGQAKQRVRLACFYKTSSSLVLPAFGTFTGKHIIKPKQEDEVYAIVAGEVVCVS